MARVNDSKPKAAGAGPRPPYYRPGNVEAWDVIEAWQLGFNLGNVLKYLCRAGLKHRDRLSDLRKAQVYLAREIECLEKRGKT